MNHVCCGLNAPHAAAKLFSAQTVFDQWIKSLEWSHQVASLQSKHTSGETFLPANLSGQTKFITIYWHIPFQRMNAKTLVGMNKNTDVLIKTDSSFTLQSMMDLIVLKAAAGAAPTYGRALIVM